MVITISQYKLGPKMLSVVWSIDSLQRLLADLPRFEDGRVLSTRNVDVILTNWR